MPKKIERLWEAIKKCNSNEIDGLLFHNGYILFLTEDLRGAGEGVVQQLDRKRPSLTPPQAADILLLIVLYLRRGLVIAADHLTEVLECVPERCASPVPGCDGMSGQHALEEAIKFLQKIEVPTEKYSGSDRPRLNLIKLFDDCVDSELTGRAKIEKYISRMGTTYDKLGISFQQAIRAFGDCAQRRIAFLYALEISDRQKLSPETRGRLKKFKLASRRALLAQFYPIALNARPDDDLKAVCEFAAYCMGDLQETFSAVTKDYLSILDKRPKPADLQSRRLMMHLYFNACMKQDDYPKAWLEHLNPRIFVTGLRSYFAMVIKDYQKLSISLDQLFPIFQTIATGHAAEQLNVKYLELYVQPYQKGKWDELKGDAYKTGVSDYVTGLYEIYQNNNQATVHDIYLIALSAGLDFLTWVDTLLQAGYRFEVVGQTWTCIANGSGISIAQFAAKCPALIKMLSDYTAPEISDYQPISEQEKILRVKAVRMLGEMKIDHIAGPISVASLDGVKQ